MARTSTRTAQSASQRRHQGRFNVRVEIDPDPSRLSIRFRGFSEMLKDWRPAWDAMIPQLRREMGRTWMSQGANMPEGRWRPWKPNYSRRRPNGALMVLTGKMLNRLTTKGVLRRSKRELRFGLRHPGAAALQFGSQDQGINKREFVSVSDGIKQIAKREMSEHVKRMLRRFLSPMGQGGT